jgi:hypothetical protein
MSQVPIQTLIHGLGLGLVCQASLKPWCVLQSKRLNVDIFNLDFNLRPINRCDLDKTRQGKSGVDKKGQDKTAKHNTAQYNAGQQKIRQEKRRQKKGDKTR